MTRVARFFAVFALATAAMLQASGARSQYYGAAPQPAPLYPYAVQDDQPYAVEVAPGTYEIRRPKNARHYPYVSGRHDVARPRRSAAGDRPVTRNDPALIEELRRRRAAKSNVAERRVAKRDVINTKRIVYDKPVVIETTRVVDDPPRVIERRHYVDDAPAPRRRRGAAVPERAAPKADAPPREDVNKKRVIEADAEVTILGPDRMSIRLFRKRRGGGAKASAE